MSIPDPHSTDEEPQGTEVIGRARRPLSPTGADLGAQHGRAVLAAALGIPAAALAALGDGQVVTALGHLRILVEDCMSNAAEAATDDLTGALRRKAGIAALQCEIDRERRQPSRGIVVAFVDANGLKHVNDTFGHASGDAFLREIVASMRSRLRSYDLVVRYGGDEFCCVLSDTTTQSAEAVLAEIAQRLHTRSGGLSISFGVATVLPEDTAESVVARADGRLYEGRAAARSHAADENVASPIVLHLTQRSGAA